MLGTAEQRRDLIEQPALGSDPAMLDPLADPRQFEGLGQTDLMRGACWAGPLRMQVRAAQLNSAL